MTTVTTTNKDFNKSLHLFDVMTHGVYSFETVLNHHKQVQEFENAVLYGMPAMDGVVFLCEHPKLETLNKRIEEHHNDIKQLNDAMRGLPYNVSRYLDAAQYRKKCRLQLLTLCRVEYWKRQDELKAVIA